jgi:hypothetical protein
VEAAGVEHAPLAEAETHGFRFTHLFLWEATACGPMDTHMDTWPTGLSRTQSPDVAHLVAIIGAGAGTRNRMRQSLRGF